MMKQRIKTLSASAVLTCAVFGAAVAGPLSDAYAANHRGDYATAYALARPLADQGDAEAQYFLADLYLLGHGVPRGSAEALIWTRRAADQGFDLAALALCTGYANGLGGAEQTTPRPPDGVVSPPIKAWAAGCTGWASCTPRAKACRRTTFSRTCG
jgi:hypothetical protein